MVTDGMKKIYERPIALTDKRMHYCPGCGHSIVHKLIAEILTELDIQDKTIGVCPVGCSVFAYDYIDIDWHEAAHGRATAVATGVKRVLPDKYVFSYQGDGDLAAIGTAETIHTANRGENLMMIFINNAIYGMTGGQMAPTTMPEQVTSTSPYGRDTKDVGFPIRIADMVAMLPGTYYVTRQSMCTPGNVRKLKKALIKGFKNQDLNKGTSFIEVVSNCPSGWKMSPVQSLQWIKDNMLPYFKLGDLKVDGILKEKFVQDNYTNVVGGK